MHEVSTRWVDAAGPEPRWSVDASPRIGQDSWQGRYGSVAGATWRGGRPMCGHGFMFHDRDYLQRHRPRWQCSTCGRVSSVPLDCCTRPDFAPHRPAGLTHLLRQWISTCGRWMLDRVRLVRGWQRRSATKAGTTQTTVRAHAVITGSVLIPPAAYDESAEGDDVVVAAGDHR